jgi:hypothetical protein
MRVIVDYNTRSAHKAAGLNDQAIEKMKKITFIGLSDTTVADAADLSCVRC